jgi:hypothetical protein
MKQGDPVAQLDQSTGLLIRGSWVRVPPGSPLSFAAIVSEPISNAHALVSTLQNCLS